MLWLLHSPSQTYRPVSRRRWYRPAVSRLEDRSLLSAAGMDLAPASSAAAAISHAVAPVAGKHPLSSVPALSSLPGARASIYLNFMGDYVPKYGRWTNISIPAYDQDGDPTTFSDGELASITTIWSIVAEDFAPFNINVTTVAPTNMAHGVTEKADIGGDGAWTGGKYGGISGLGDFVQTGTPNIAFAFPANFLSNGVPGYPRFTADAISHELGHSFGLNHQCVYSGTTLTQPYNSGPGNGTAPLMGSSYGAARSIWWYGTSSSSTIYQDDMAVIAGATNGFGYRPNPGNTTAATAAPLTVQNTTGLSASGVIIHPTDQNYFKFTAGAGQVGFTVSVNAGANNLAPRIVLLDATGSTVIASAGPSSTDFSASVTATLPRAGTYLVMVASSDGQYGNVGQYSIRGIIGAAAPPSQGGGSNTGSGSGTGTGSTTGTSSPSAPAGVSAVVVNPNQIALSWSGVPGATGYAVYRSSGGPTWVNVGVLGAGVTTFSNTGLAPQTTYGYVVYAVANGRVSAPSAIVWASTPAPPTSAPPTGTANVAIVSRAARSIMLGWQAVPGATGYQIERSSNGRAWSVAGRTSGNGSTSFSDSSVGPNRMYIYRVRAFNAWGSAPASPALRVMTPRASAMPRSAFLRPFRRGMRG